MGKKSKKLRLHEFAKEIGKTSKEVLDVAVTLKLEIKQSSSTGLTEEQVAKLKEAFKIAATKKRTPLKLAIAPKPLGTKKIKKQKAPAPEKEKEEEKEEKKPVKPTKIKTAAQVRREARIKKRIKREEEKKRKEEELKKEEKEALKKRKKEPKKKAKKAKEKEPVKKLPEKKSPKKKEDKEKEVETEILAPESKPDQSSKVEKPVYKMVSSAPDIPLDNKDTEDPNRRIDFASKHNFRPRFRRHRYVSQKDRDKTTTERKRKRAEDKAKGLEQPLQPAIPSTIEIIAPLTVREFSQQIGVKVQEIIIKLLNENTISNINTVIDKDTVEYLAELFDKKITFKKEADIEEDFMTELNKADDEKDLKNRNPIVTFLGHVDHGKTSLLDAIREEGVAGTESGGITQHTTAYRYNKGDRNITFIDTPGHAVFTEMRVRGANVTDIVVLVIATDDGIMPQTREAYDHAVAANVPIVVAMNKIDLPQADVNRLKGQLAELGLTPEDWGGSTQCAAVSAVTGEGLENLLDLIMLESEILELKANPGRPAQAVVLETRLSETQGISASLIVKKGTLKKGDCFLCGKTYGRIRHMWDADNKAVSKADPSTPVVAVGFNESPVMGDFLYVVDEIQKAKAIADKRASSASTIHIQKTHVTMATLFDNIKKQDLKELNIILKADSKGSVEAILKGIQEIGTHEVAIKVVHSGVGGINESDIMLADASNAIVMGFHVSPESRIEELANDKGVEIRRYHVIYEIFKEMEEALSGMLEPHKKEEITGKIEVRRIFNISKIGTIAGCYVVSGTVKKSSNVRLLRDNIEVYDGKIDALKRMKDDAAEVKENYECGIKIEGFDDIKEGDMIEAYQIVEIQRELSTVLSRK